MERKQIQCQRKVADVQTAWRYICDFGSDWHPNISTNDIVLSPSGAQIREFKDNDGAEYREQLTYLSSSDQRLRYAMLSGVDGVSNYAGEVVVDDEQCVTWSASFEAEGRLAERVAAGTRQIFDNGLIWLAEKNDATFKPLVRQDKAAGKAPVGSERVRRSPALSVQTPDTSTKNCWTLVLFLHGIGGNAGNWQEQLSRLGGDYTVASMDLRGYGQSELGSTQTTIDDHCDDILQVMKHFGARRLVLVGLSMGSWIATSFAMRHPNLLAGLVLSGGCTGMSEAAPEERRSFQEARTVPLEQGLTPADFAENVVEIIAGPNISDAQREVLLSSMQQIDSATYRDALACFCNPEERFDFSRLNFPILMMTGEFDRLASPEEIRALSLRIFDEIASKDCLPDLRFEVLKGAGHLCNVEQPEQFNHHLGEFLKRLPGAGSKSSARKEAKRQAKSQRIVDAALAEFSSNGFDGVSMAKIADRASVSKPTLYQYFGDKEQLFAAVLQEGCDHIMMPLTSPQGNLVDRLWQFSWTYAEFVLRPDMLSLARLVLGECSRRPEIAKAYHDAGPGRALKGLMAFVQECNSLGQLEVDDVELAAHDLWSLILSGPRDHYLHFVTERPTQGELLRSIAHGLTVFIKVYSTDSQTDLQKLTAKVGEARATDRDSRGTIL